MNLPSLPTDNLYKFMAIFGLVIFFFSFYLEISSFESLRDSDIELNLAVNKENFYQGLYGREFYMIRDKIASEVDRSDKLSDLTSEILKSLEDQKRIPKDRADKIYDQIKDIESQMSEIRENVEANFDTIKKFYRILAEVEANTNKITLTNKKLESRYARDFEYSKWLLVFSVLLMLFGFSLWYNKHQKYIDAERKWKGETFVELLREKELKGKIEQQTDNQEPDTDTESDS